LVWVWVLEAMMCNPHRWVWESVLEKDLERAWDWERV
jgi:hypothetical protein